MRLIALLTVIFVLTGAFDCLTAGLFGVSISSLLLGANTIAQRLFFCFVGASGIFQLAFLLIYKPFKSLAK